MDNNKQACMFDYCWCILQCSGGLACYVSETSPSMVASSPPPPLLPSSSSPFIVASSFAIDNKRGERAKHLFLYLSFFFHSKPKSLVWCSLKTSIRTSERARERSCQTTTTTTTTNLFPSFFSSPPRFLIFFFVFFFLFHLVFHRHYHSLLVTSVTTYTHFEVCRVA